MATNSLTPEQDLAFRAFFKVIQGGKNILVDSPAHRRQLMAICLEALNYIQLPNGSFVNRTTKISIPFGSTNYDAYPDEWADDEEYANDTINNQGGPETSASGTPQNTKVRETILSEDV